MRRRGLTLIELLVVISIIGLLAGLLLVAVQQVRESGRRSQCVANLRQIGLACQAYHATHRMFPPGASNGLSFHVAILPQMEMGPLFKLANYHTGRPADTGPENQQLRTTLVPGYVCPSDPESHSGRQNWMWGTNYAGNSGTGILRSGFNGIFQRLQPYHPAAYPEGPVRAEQVRDGLSNTAMVGEIAVGNGEIHPLRIVLNTAEVVGKDRFDEFVQTCKSMPIPGAGGAFNPHMRGRPWIMGESGYTWYNHVLSPNGRSCFNRGLVQEGIYTAAGFHPGGVNVLYADGHVDFVSESVDRVAWTKMGSRSGDSF